MSTNDNQYIALVDSLPELIWNQNRGDNLGGFSNRLAALSKEFSNVYLELGSGSGGHLIERAAADPSSLFIGIELRYKRTFRTIEKAREYRLKNLYMIRGSFNEIVSLCHGVEISGVYLNFPDPWDKRRWKKHRAISVPFVTDLGKVLKSHGFFSFKTDHEEYFDLTHKIFSGAKDFDIKESSRDLHSSEYAVGNIYTEFERLFASQKLPTFYLLARKVSP